jgi:hypothetical protein
MQHQKRTGRARVGPEIRNFSKRRAAKTQKMPTEENKNSTSHTVNGRIFGPHGHTGRLGQGETCFYLVFALLLIILFILAVVKK